MDSEATISALTPPRQLFAAPWMDASSGNTHWHRPDAGVAAKLGRTENAFFRLDENEQADRTASLRHRRRHFSA